MFPLLSGMRTMKKGKFIKKLVNENLIYDVDFEIQKSSMNTKMFAFEL